MKKILALLTLVLSSWYFFNTEKPTQTTQRDSWEESLDSIATAQVEEMFLLLEVYSPQEWVRFERIWYDENSWEILRIKLQPMNSWGRFIDTRSSEGIPYRCSQCNGGICFSDEIRLRWHDNPPHVRLKEDYLLNQGFLKSCEEGRYYLYNSPKKFFLSVIERTSKVNGVLCYECNASNE